jgi:ABC-type amino acid transport substrate-binding protein
VAALLALAAPAAPAAEPAARPVLRVCQDPNNLPFSRRDLAGFENRIAALFAQELGWDIAYTWFPQRMGFVRNTLRAKEPGTERYKCDLITGVAKGFDLGATTQPYYRSTYAMAYVRGKGLDAVRTLDDLLDLPPERRAGLKLGVFGGSPVADWLLAHGLMDQIVSYQPQSGDAEEYPGQIVENDLDRGPSTSPSSGGRSPGISPAARPTTTSLPCRSLRSRACGSISRSPWPCASATAN